MYLAASFGAIPSPALIARWSGTLFAERYPCEEGRCGCASAYECWTHCCCHSEHELLVWALENGVMPPSYAHFTEGQWIAAAETVRPGITWSAFALSGIKDRLARGVALSPAHADRSVADCCGNAPASPAKAASSCCHEPASGAAEPCDSDSPACTKSRPPLRLATLSPLSCKGLEQLLLITLPPSPPQPQIVLLLPEPRTPYAMSWPQDEAFDSRTLDTPEPPPRATSPLG